MTASIRAENTIRPRIAKTLCAATLVACSLASGAAYAVAALPAYYDSLDLSTTYEITDIARLNFDHGEPGYGMGWGGWSVPQGESFDALGYGSPTGVARWFFLGLSTLGDESDEPVRHVVVFANDTFADNAVGKSLATLFPGTDETALAANLRGMNTGAEGNPWDPVFTFGSGIGDSVAFEPGQTFKIVAFSDGQIIGSGTSMQIAPVPEPEAYAMLLAGLGVLGAVARARRQRR